MIGPGKYDDVCTAARERAKAVAALLLIVEGEHGNGFSVQTAEPELLLHLPTMLRVMANEIEADLERAN